jgi:hypothetical protein
MKALENASRRRKAVLGSGRHHSRLRMALRKTMRCYWIFKRDAIGNYRVLGTRLITTRKEKPKCRTKEAIIFSRPRRVARAPPLKGVGRVPATKHQRTILPDGTGKRLKKCRYTPEPVGRLAQLTLGHRPNPSEPPIQKEGARPFHLGRSDQPSDDTAEGSAGPFR